MMYFLLLSVENEFNARVNSVITTFKTRTANDFMLVISLTRLGLLASGTQNNITYKSSFVNDSWMIDRYSPAPSSLSTCSCSVLFDCSTVRGQFLCVHGNNCTADTVVWTVPGLLKGCVNIDNMLLSDLRCFYNQTCIDTMLSMYNVDMPDRLPLSPAILGTVALNNSVTSRFLPTDPLATLFSELMVEEWDIQGDFKGYYDICAPDVCTYLSTQRTSIISVVTIVISFSGGLFVALRLILTWIGRFTDLLTLYWNHRDSNTNQGQSVTDTGLTISAGRIL
jgi:hypothetical protein